MMNPQMGMPPQGAPMGAQGMPQQQQQQQMQPEMLPPQLQDLSLKQIQSKSFQKDNIPKKLKRFMEMDNVAETLDDEQLTKISEICIQGFDIDKNSRKEWEEVMKKAFELVETGLKGKNIPWEGAANIKYPLVTGACIQFNARINPEIIKNDMVVSVRSMIPDSQDHSRTDRATRLGNHMSYQLLGQSTHWIRDTDKLLMMLPMAGTVFRKSFFNTITGEPDTVLCMPQDIIINQNVQDLDTAQRITHMLYMTNNDLISNMKAGLFLDYPIEDLARSYKDISTVSMLDDIQHKEQDVQVAETFTTKKDNNSERIYDVVHEVLEQHRWLDLDGDGYQEPYIVTVHKGTRKILRIVSRYDERSFEFKDNGDFTKIKATSYFTDYHFIPDPNGNYYSLGFGILLLPTNETVNSLLNQLLDAGTLANRQCGFIGSEFRLPSGDYTVKPGEWKKIQSTPGQVISANIVPLPIKEPSQTLFALMQFLIESSKQITNITDIMAGQLPPPNMPATSTMAMLEQSQQIYNGILYRVHDSLKKEFQKLYDLNRKYLKDEEGFLFAQQFNQVTIQDYESEDYGIYPVADPKLASQMQRLMQAQAMLDLAQFPQINKLEVLTNYLQVLKIAEPKQYLILNPPPPPEVALTNAKTKYTDMQTLSLLMDKELKAIHLNIMEMKEKAKTMYYGGKLATDKVAATVALAQLNQIETPEQVEKAVSEEEAITQGTQMQDQSPEVLQHLDALQKMVDQMMGQAQSTTAPQQMPGLPPEGKIPQLSQEISPAEQLQGTV